MLGRIRSQGLLYVAGIIFSRCVPSWLIRVRLFHIYELSTYASEAAVACADRRQIVRCGADQDHDDARLVTRSPVTERHVGRSEAWVCREGEQLLAGVWTGEEWFLESDLGVLVLMAEDHYWVFSARTESSVRQKGAYRQLLNRVVVDKQPKRAFCAINPTNKASMAAHRSRFENQVGRYVAARFFKTSFCFSLSGPRASGMISWNGEMSPIQIRLNESKPTQASS